MISDRAAKDISTRRRFERTLVEAIARERRHLASELHHGLGQELFGIALLAKSLSSASQLKSSALRQDLARLASLSGKAMQTCRGVAQDISPLDGAQTGLIDALKRITRMPLNWTGPNVTFTVTESSPLRLSSEAMEDIYSLAQEGLANALKHADAARVSVSLHIQTETITLEIVDDGVGLARQRRDSNPGFGLTMMRYRANLLHGTFGLKGRPSGGTRLTLKCKHAFGVPLTSS
jgi:signal transduction histidine kinase